MPEPETNEALRTAGAWLVYPAYVVTDDLLTPKPPYVDVLVDSLRPTEVPPLPGMPRVRWYFPVEQPELLSEVQKLEVGDEAGLVRFAETYGGFGYRKLFQLADPKRFRELPGLPPPADPLPWIWQHVQGVGLAADAAEILTQRWGRARERAAERFVRKLVRDLTLEEQRYPGGRTLWYLPYAAGARRHRIGLDLAAPLRSVAELYTALVDGNLRHVRFTPRADPDSGISSVLAFPALISVVYWQLHEAASQRVLRRCQAEDCGRLFFTTDRRQRYCPRAMGRTKSTCAGRVQQRVLRQRQRRRRRQTPQTPDNRQRAKTLRPHRKKEAR